MEEPDRAGESQAGEAASGDDREFYVATLDSLDAQVAVLDGDGVIVAVNAAWTRFAEENGGRGCGRGSNYLAACDAAPDDPYAQRVTEGLRAMLHGSTNELRIEYPCHGPDEERWFAMRAVHFRGAGPARIVMHHQDVTERVRAQEAARLRARLLDAANAGVIATDVAGRVTHWTCGAEKLYGWTEGEAVGRPIAELTVPPDSRAREGETFAELLRDGQWQGDFEMRRKDGSTFVGTTRNTVLLGDDGSPTEIVGVSADITHRVQAEHELREARDHLRAVTASMGEALITLDRGGRVTYLNAAAEKLLGWTLGEMDGRGLHATTHFRHADGTPFPEADCPLIGALHRGTALRVEEDMFVHRDGSEVWVSYTSAPLEGERGLVIVMTDITETRQERERTLAELRSFGQLRRLRDALDEDRLVLFAQPIVELASGETVQHELLVRMVGVDGTLILPGEFLPAAEKFGLVRELDRWVIEQAARLAGGGLSIEINISADSLGDPELYDVLERAVRREGVDPACLVLEITETALMTNPQTAHSFLTRARHLGCGIALDDFGTGYGSFTQLKNLPVDYLKIDIEFVRDLVTSPSSHHVVQAVVALAKAFGHETVAEGVEDDATLAALRELGVDFVQGYLLGRPAPLSERFDPAALGLTSDRQPST